MKIYKSGVTTGTSVGTVTVLSTKPNDPEVADVAIIGMLACSGDSGAPAYTYINGKAYIVGMLTTGDGSVGLKPGSKRCFYPLKPESQRRAGVRSIDVMCAAAGLNDCVNQARQDWASSVDPNSVPDSWTGGQDVSFPITLTNVGGKPWSQVGASQANPFRISLAWDNGTFDTRYELPRSLQPGESATFNVTIKAPTDGGRHTLKARMVQDGVRWFPSTFDFSKEVSVTGAPTPPPDTTPPPVTTPPQPTPPPSRDVNQGSFEGGLGGWQLRRGDGISSWRLYNEPANAHDGNSFLAFSTALNGSVLQDIAANTSPSQDVVVTAALRSQENSASGLMCVWLLGSTNQQNCTRYNVGKKWETMQVMVDPNANRGLLRIEFYPDANGNTTFIDTVNLQVLSPEVNQGSFEGGLGGWQLRQGDGITSWRQYNEPANAHDGSNFLAFNTALNGSVFQDIAANTSPSQDVVVTAAVRSQEDWASGLMCVWLLGPTNQPNCTRYNVGKKWETMQVMVDPDANRSTVRIEFYPDANGTTTFIDTVNLQVLSPEVNQGSFEGGLGGWQLRQGDGITSWRQYNEPANAHDGSNFLAFNTARNGSVFQDIAVNTSPSQDVVVTAALRSQENSASGMMCAWLLGSTNQPNCTRYNVGTKWETMQVMIDPNADRGLLRIEFYPDANGTTTFIDTVNFFVR